MSIDTSQLVYEKFSGEFRLMISDQIVQLSKIDREYKDLLNQIIKIKENNSKIKQLYNGDIIELTKADCEDLQKVIDLQHSMRIKEENAIFYLGGGEVIRYLKKIEEFKKQG